MASPNIVGVTAIRAYTSQFTPSTTSATLWSTANGASLNIVPATDVVHKIGFLSAANVTNAAATITVAVNSAANGSGTSTRLVYQIVVPAGATLVILDKITPVYLTDTQSLVVTSGTASAIELVAAFEAIS
jgi:hypothetical protein